jgi:serine/threonine protein kinase
VYCEKGDFKEQIRVRAEKSLKYTEDEIWNFARQIISVLRYMHDKKVAHRDLSPDNILLQDDTTYLVADYDIAKQLDNTGNNTYIIGKHSYNAPEVLTGNYSVQIDIWSLGAILYEMMTFTQSSKSFESMSRKDDQANLHEKMRQSMSLYSPKLVNMVLSMLEYEASIRPTANYLFCNYISAEDMIPQIDEQAQQIHDMKQKIESLKQKAFDSEHNIKASFKLVGLTLVLVYHYIYGLLQVLVAFAYLLAIIFAKNLDTYETIRTVALFLLVCYIFYILLMY